jgi:hypothetical protein
MRTRTLIATTLAALCATGSVQAQNWEFAPRLQLGYEFNDNYRLDFPGNEVDVSGGMADVSLPIRLVNPVKRAEIAPRIRSTLFPGDRDEDSNDYFLTGMYEQRTQRQVFGIEGEVSREDVVRSELPATDIDSNLGDPTTGDAARRLLRNERDLIRIEPYWQYDISQRNRIEAGAHYLDSNYKESFEGAQEDFTDYGVYGGVGFRLSQRSTVLVRGRASRYDTVFDADAYGAEVEWRSDYTQNAHLYARVGAQQTDLDRSGTSSQTNVIAGVGGRWTWPTTNLFTDLTRTVGPTSAGAVVERTQLRLRLQRAIRPRFSIMGGVRGNRDEAIDDASSYPTRKYLTGEMGFDWRLTRTWSMVGVYRYIWQEYSDEPSDRSSNAINLGVVYEPGRGE